ncbi:MAG: hypothetical protein WCX88_00515 [Patescibacteria group bacterium]
MRDNNYWQEFKIALKNIFLWDENARFSDKYFNKDEKELIAHFCNKKDFKIEEFTREVIKDFDLPQVEKIIIYNNGEKNIVVEGNRRITVYKLLNNPELAPNDVLKDFFIKEKKEISINNDFLFDCIVTDNLSESFRYIERKHLKGNNEVDWGEQERTNHNVRRGNATQKEEFKVAVAKIIKELDLPEELKENILGHGFVTNFWRIIDSSVVWKKYGISFKKDGGLEIKDKSFTNHLKVIIWNVLQKEDFSGNKIDSRTLNTNKEKETYLNSISDKDVNKVSGEIKSHTKGDLFGGKSIDTAKGLKGGKSNPKSILRCYLIPKICILNIYETKINNIYCELKNDLVLGDSKKAVPNAVGVLFRVFLEISIDYFADKKGFSFNPDTKLAGKITIVADYMEKNKFAVSKQLKNIRKVATDHNSILAIENFHEYVHSYKSQPSPSDLKLKWDNLQEFFEILWGSFKIKNKK